MPESPKNVADAIAAFRAAADAKGDGDSLSAREDHALHARMAEAVWALDDLGQDGLDALEGLAADSSPHVRSWAAAELLSRGDRTVVPILEELARHPGLMGFSAEMTIRQFRKGELGSPFGTRPDRRRDTD